MALDKHDHNRLKLGRLGWKVRENNCKVKAGIDRRRWVKRWLIGAYPSNFCRLPSTFFSTLHFSRLKCCEVFNVSNSRCLILQSFYLLINDISFC